MMDDENSYPSNRPNFPVESSNVDKHDDDDDNDEDDEEKTVDHEVEEEEDDDDDDVGNGVQRIGKGDYEDGEENDSDHGNSQGQPKKRKLKNLFPNYEFAPRVQPPSSSSTRPSKSPYGGRNPLTDWTERETFILLDSWGERFIKHGRKSLRSEEWQEVSQRVCKESKVERTNTQCRNRVDTLKKKYKKEKTKCGPASEWVYFKKMDSLMSSGPQQGGLSRGSNSGELGVSTSPKVGLNISNELDEMTDCVSTGSFKMLADSFRKFSDVYEKVESSKRAQMVELERMRMEFHRDLEVEKREIVERAQAEIARIRQGDYED